MIELSRNQIAELRGCTASTVSRAHLPKTQSGKYDLTDPEVWGYVTAPEVERKVDDIKNHMLDDYGDDPLDAELKRSDIALKKRREQILAVQYETEKKNLVPIETIAIWIGHFASGIRNNLFPIGARIARGDKKLQAKFDREIETASKNILENAAAQLRQETEKIIEAMEKKN